MLATLVGMMVYCGRYFSLLLLWLSWGGVLFIGCLLIVTDVFAGDDVGCVLFYDVLRFVG